LKRYIAIRELKEVDSPKKTKGTKPSRWQTRPKRPKPETEYDDQKTKET